MKLLNAHKYVKTYDEFILTEERMYDGPNTLILPKGYILFHGTSGKFEGGPKPGLYDNVFWTTEEPAYAQMYIPIAATTTWTTPHEIAEPSSNAIIQSIQKDIGIEYNYPSKDWKTSSAKIHINPKFENLLEDGTWLTDEYVAAVLYDAGYDMDDDSWDATITLQFDHSENLLMRGEKMTGYLYIITLKEDLRILDTLISGGIHKELGEIGYNNVGLFKQAANKFDAIRIFDEAQAHIKGRGERRDNIPHNSIGLFSNTINKITWDVVSAQHPDYEWVEKNNWMTPEYLEYIGK